MSQFEYISVAVALIYALVVAKILGELTFCMQKERRYPIHLAWLFALLLASAMNWWQFWGVRSVEWTPLRFIWILMVPSILYLRVALLVGDSRHVVESFERHFFKHRKQFFTLGLASAAILTFSPWVLGFTIGFQVQRFQFGGACLALISLIGFLFKSEKAQWLVVFLSYTLVIYLLLS